MATGWAGLCCLHGHQLSSDIRNYSKMSVNRPNNGISLFDWVIQQRSKKLFFLLGIRLKLLCAIYTT